MVEPQPSGRGTSSKTRKVGGDDEEGRERKRRKVDVKAGKKAIEGLLGGYGSDSDEEMEEGQIDAPRDEKDIKESGLSLLGGYGASDDDGEAEEDGGERQSPDTPVLEDSENEEPELDPAAVLEVLKRIRGIEGKGEEDDGSWLKDAYVPGHHHDSEEEEIDWGDSLEDEEGGDIDEDS